jgi:hypothetical protein
MLASVRLARWIGEAGYRADDRRLAMTLEEETSIDGMGPVVAARFCPT